MLILKVVFNAKARFPHYYYKLKPTSRFSTLRIPGWYTTPQSTASRRSEDPTTSPGDGRSYPSLGAVAHADYCRFYPPSSLGNTSATRRTILPLRLTSYRFLGPIDRVGLGMRSRVILNWHRLIPSSCCLLFGNTWSSFLADWASTGYYGC